MFEGHLQRLRTGIKQTFSTGLIPNWICNNTKLKGKPFSYKDHEYQLKIVQDPSPEKITMKCSQIGLSELTFRETLAILRMLPGTTAIYTMPSSKQVEKIVKTRIDPIIAESEDLSNCISNDVNSSEVKQFGQSFFYFNGTYGQTQAISTPADLIVHDEVDFSNLEVLTTYESRLTHSPYKFRREFSTPTLPGRGISARLENSRRHLNMCKCDHCSRWFLPDYYEHVKIPGYSSDLKQLTAANLHLTSWRQAALHCPHCGAIPSLQVEQREWVVENSQEQHVAAGFMVSPFDAPNVIATSYLVERSTKYERISDFINFNLGKPYLDATETLTDQTLRRLFIPAQSDSFSGMMMGCDMGAVCYIVIGNRDSNGVLLIVHYERVPLGEFETRRQKLIMEYRVMFTVMDALPYTDMVMNLQKREFNLLAAIYVRGKQVATYSVRDQEKNEREGKLQIRQVNINRNVAFDDLVRSMIRGEAVVLDRPDKETFISHMLDMKRMPVINKDNEIEYVWVKSEKGDDHYMHATLYLATATHLRGMVRGAVSLGPLMSKFKAKTM